MVTRQRRRQQRLHPARGPFRARRWGAPGAPSWALAGPFVPSRMATYVGRVTLRHNYRIHVYNSFVLLSSEINSFVLAINLKYSYVEHLLTTFYNSLRQHWFRNIPIIAYIIFYLVQPSHKVEAPPPSRSQASTFVKRRCNPNSIHAGVRWILVR